MVLVAAVAHPPAVRTTIFRRPLGANHPSPRPSTRHHSTPQGQPARPGRSVAGALAGAQPGRGNDLARAMRRNPHTKMLVASGRDHDTGHMMYSRRADLAKFHTGLAAWLG